MTPSHPNEKPGPPGPGRVSLCEAGGPRSTAQTHFAISAIFATAPVYPAPSSPGLAASTAS